MSSIMGYAGIVRMSDYNASKAALINLNETLRYELDNVYAHFSLQRMNSENPSQLQRTWRPDNTSLPRTCPYTFVPTCQDGTERLSEVCLARCCACDRREEGDTSSGRPAFVVHPSTVLR